MTSHRFKYNGRIERSHRRWLYIIAGGTWLSGALWLLFHHFLMRGGKFGPAPHPMEPWLIKLHGLFAFAAVWIFGLIWGVHVSKALPFQRRKLSGWAVIVLMAVLTATGYLLYYAGGDAARQIISVSHWAIGLAAPAIVLMHWSRTWQRRMHIPEDARERAAGGKRQAKEAVRATRV